MLGEPLLIRKIILVMLFVVFLSLYMPWDGSGVHVTIGCKAPWDIWFFVRYKGKKNSTVKVVMPLGAFGFLYLNYAKNGIDLNEL